MLDAMESAALRPEQLSTSNDLGWLHNSFKSSVLPAAGVFDGANSSFDASVARLTEVGDPTMIVGLHSNIMNEVKRMVDGVELSDGTTTRGLNEIHRMKINPEYYEQNLNQQAGFAAEVISVERENVNAMAEGSSLRSYRADDRPDLGFSKNDQYVDKIRVNADGQVVERIQTKFVGKDGADWVKKATGKKFDKYFEGDHVDKIECPKEYFDEAKASIAKEKEDIGRQLERANAEGKVEVVAEKQAKLDRLNQLDDMIEQSTVTKSEARYAKLHPHRFAAKVFTIDTLKAGTREGLKGGAIAAGLTFASSSLEHAGEFLDGDISADEMVTKIADETGTAGMLGVGTQFVTTVIGNSMQSSSHTLIQKVGGSCLPAAMVSFAVESYDSVMDFAEGQIDGKELAYDLGHNAASIGGGTLAGVKGGAMLGAAFGPVGGVAGGIVGGAIGTAVACGAYETAVEIGSDIAPEIATQVESFASTTMDLIVEEVPEQAKNARESFNSFFAEYDIPVRI